MQIDLNVHQITVGVSTLEGIYPPNVFLVTGDRAAFVDSGYRRDDDVRKRLDYWRKLNEPEIAAIVLTHRHRDHIGGAKRLHGATGGTIMCTPAERSAIQDALEGTRVGKVAADSETLDLGGVTLEFIHTPGHTVGSMCVYYREQRALFTGDTILGTGATLISPDHGDMGLYLESLRKLLTYDTRVIFPGHGPAIDRPRAKIQSLIERRLAREKQILGLLQGGESDVEGMFKIIYAKLHPQLHDMARGQIRAHLLKLQREGRVQERPHGVYRRE